VSLPEVRLPFLTANLHPNRLQNGAFAGQDGYAVIQLVENGLKRPEGPVETPQAVNSGAQHFLKYVINISHFV
jgi:hypothetical protein